VAAAVVRLATATPAADAGPQVCAIMIVPLYMENVYRPCYCSHSPRSRQAEKLQESAAALLAALSGQVNCHG
jgi:hypothetical protein